jgi:hypothetical protein
MKAITKFLLVGAVAVTAIALSAAPSEAAKKKAKTAALCNPAHLCASNCTGGLCKVNICGGDGKWYQALFTPVCVGACPPACS